MRDNPTVLTDKEHLVAILSRIEQRLVALNYSESAACKEAGVSKDTVRDIRRGRSPSVEKMIKLAPVLKCRLEWLLTGAGMVTNGEEDQLTQRQKAWLEQIDRLPKDEQERLWKLARALAKPDDEHDLKKIVS